MDTRKVIALIEVDADRAFDEIDDGPVPYLEREFGWLEQSGIVLTSCFLADEDEDDKWQAYLNYLVEWAFNHQGEGSDCLGPDSFDKWSKNSWMANECPLGGDVANDCADCAYAGDFHYENGECVARPEENT